MNAEAATQERFEALQRKLVPLWHSIRAMGEDEQTIVAVPSMTVDDPEAGCFFAPSGRAKCFVASDDVESPAYRRLTPDDLFEVAMQHRLHFEPTRQTGVVFHMMSALADCGRVGLTAVADTHDDADALFRRAVAALDAEAAQT